MRNFSSELLSVEVVEEALLKIERKHRLIITSAGQMKLYVAIPDEDSVDHWHAEFWTAVDQLIGKDEEPKKGVLRSFDPSEVKFLTESDIKRDLFLNHLFSRQTETTEQLPLPHLDRWLRPDDGGPGALVGRPARVVFYSYKGGVGRTTALVLCAMALANSGNKVAVIDLDLEAPGLSSTLFFPGGVPRRGVVDFFLGLPAINRWLQEQDHDRLHRFWHRYLPSYDGPFANGGSLVVWGAGGVDPLYPQKLAHLAFEHAHRQPIDPMQRMIDMVTQAVPELDYILIDSRTGLADIGGSLIFHYADVVCGLFHANAQTQDGLRVFIHQLLADTNAPSMLWVDSQTRPVNNGDSDLKTAELKNMINEILVRENDALPLTEDLHQIKFNDLLSDLSPAWFHTQAGTVTEQNPELSAYVSLAARIDHLVQQRRSAGK